ncbi:serine/threonine protein kinase [Pendulispora rubella]|uniref:Serine/threonine protein kinase n=1 Tax=Pendulispora rubella TaxID=2741070 RepID=A0ABZ2KT70_9BACT
MIAAGDVLELDSVPYRVGRELGQGGTGVVHEIHRVDDQGVEPLAIKVLRPDIDISEREREHFLLEAERMRRVPHSGLVGVLGAGTLVDGRPYLLMPRLRGECLSERLERGPLPPEEAIRIFAKLACAVHAVHAASMIHRDIKPENVFIVDGNPVLLDFGIARDMHAARSTTTAEGRIRGTPAYMAPERFFGEPASVASDIYELGVVLYFMLAGHLPWNSGTDVRQRLHPASPRLSGVSPGLTATVLEALSTRPEARFPDAEAFAARVEAVRFDIDASDSPDRLTVDIAIPVSKRTTVAWTPPAREWRGHGRVALGVLLLAVPAFAAMAMTGEHVAVPLVVTEPAEPAAPASAVDAAVAKIESAAQAASAPPSAPEPPKVARPTVRAPAASARARDDEVYFEDRR